MDGIYGHTARKDHPDTFSEEGHMQRLQLLNGISKKNSVIGVFAGLNRTETKQDSEFRDMKNLSSDGYPTLVTRPPRSDVQKNFTKCNGLYWKNGLAYVDGTTFYYKDVAKGTVADNKKTMIGMGAYIVIMPDKKIFNTSDGSMESMEASWTQNASATIAPTYDASTYAKISCSGIGSAFNKGDAVNISGCTQDVLNGSKVIQEIGADYIVVIGQINAQTTQQSGITIKRTVPDMDYMCESDNRLWGCSSENHEIYACKLGDPKNWNSFEGTSMDSYAATVGSDGDFTGCISYMGYVLFFKEDCIHKIYGTKPSNMQITTYPYRGVAEDCSRSLCVVNETLYYAGRNGILRYDGAMPEDASAALGVINITEAAAEAYEGKYYVSIKDESGSTSLYVFDPRYGTWHREDETWFEYAKAGSGELYYVANNKLRTIADSSGSERIEWYADSGAQFEGSLNRKRVSELQLMVEMEKDTLFEVFVTYDESMTWQRVYSKKAPDRISESVSIVPRKCNHFRYKIQGAGKFKLYALSKTVRIAGKR